MKNYSYRLAIFVLLAIFFTSCAGSKGSYQRKGYGCPSTAYLSIPQAENQLI